MLRLPAASVRPLDPRLSTSAVVRSLLSLAWLSFFPSCLPAQEVNFARDIRPILSANCFHCHGADENHREAGLRLDVRSESTAEREDGAAIVPGKPDESVLVRRITSDDPLEVMPPTDSGKALKPEQIELLKRWVEEGAEYTDHWAFVAPDRPQTPAVEKEGWLRNEIDSFILARLEREGLAPSPQADPVTWIRRLHFDLVGLPPEPRGVQQFLSELRQATDDESRERVYSAWIEKLLASPHFGEKWGRQWLDAARYADSDGFEKDKPRNVWFYRDYVIDSLNADKPYDQFLIEQIAGDLLPNATQEQIVATGFLRNSMINEEGGVDPEQFRMEAMFDRMDAVGKAMLGLTVQCCQCHNHKYDPFTQLDYYRMFAFLNNCHEGSITVYTDEQQQKRAELLSEIGDIEQELKKSDPAWPAKMAAWVESVRGNQPQWTIVRPELDASGGQKHYLLKDGSILAQGYAPTKHTTEFTVETTLKTLTAFRLELLNDPNLPHGGPGRAPDGLCALSEFKVTVTPLGEGKKASNVKFSAATADVNPPERELAKRYDDKSKKKRVTGPIAYAIDNDNDTAWGIDAGGGRSNVPRKAVFNLEQPLKNEEGFRITFRLVQMHGGWNSDDNQNNNLGRFRFSVTDEANTQADPLPAEVRELVQSVPDAQSVRDAGDPEKLFSYWRTQVSEWKDANERIEALWQQHPRGTSQLVAIERDKPRSTHRLERGNFLKPAEEVMPGVPEFLHPLDRRRRAKLARSVPDTQSQSVRDTGASQSVRDTGASQSLRETGSLDRLDFALWIADRRSPTTARAIVNRIWQGYFGVGLVETSEDLGTQGELPSHPDLLDWLAVELMDSNWSLKHIHRLIASSSTYRQSSKVTPELYARDPYNRLLARGPRFRLDAELVRDAALAASGLLNPEVGGPSVYPPAPEFLFQPPASYGPKRWAHEEGAQNYRRAIYTFRFRSVPYPVLETFDAPNGDVACVRRARSNTPLQALTTLNEPLFVQCAQALALKAIREGGATDDQRLAYAFQRCVARLPDETEQNQLLSFLNEQRRQFAAGDGQPQILPDDGVPLPSGTTPNEAAAWTALARVLLNLDETISKE